MRRWIPWVMVVATVASLLPSSEALEGTVRVDAPASSCGGGTAVGSAKIDTWGVSSAGGTSVRGAATMTATGAGNFSLCVAVFDWWEEWGYFGTKYTFKSVCGKTTSWNVIGQASQLGVECTGSTDVTAKGICIVVEARVGAGSGDHEGNCPSAPPCTSEPLRCWQVVAE